MDRWILKHHEIIKALWTNLMTICWTLSQYKVSTSVLFSFVLRMRNAFDESENACSLRLWGCEQEEYEKIVWNRAITIWNQSAPTNFIPYHHPSDSNTLIPSLDGKSNGPNWTNTFIQIVCGMHHHSKSLENYHIKLKVGTNKNYQIDVGANKNAWGKNY